MLFNPREVQYSANKWKSKNKVDHLFGWTYFLIGGFFALFLGIVMFYIAFSENNWGYLVIGIPAFVIGISIVVNIYKKS